MTVTMWSSVILVISCSLTVPTNGASLVREKPIAATDFAEHIQHTQGTNDVLASELTSIFVRSKRQQPAQCQQVGGYCARHEDCCSGLCLSFSYKCVSRPPQSPFTPILTQGPAGSGAGGSTTVIQGGGFEDIVNRFGGSTSNNTVANTCAPVGGYCQRSSDCCSKTCLSFSYKCITNNNIPVVRPPSQTQQGDSNIFEVGHPIPSPEDAITIDELVNRFGGNDKDDNTLTSNGVVVAPRPSPTNSPPLSNTGTSAAAVHVPSTSLSVPTLPNTSTGGSSSSIGVGVGPGNKFQCVVTGGQCQYSNQCCSRLCAQTSPDNRFCAVQVLDLTPPGQQSHGSSLQVNSENCQPIGGTCYSHKDCCSTRCHIYLQKCVT